MARESDGSDRVFENGCPLQCRLRYTAMTEDPVADHCDWAGLPINLDFAFSQDQRDKVYKQHLLRRRGTQFGPWRHNFQCVCETAENESLTSG